MRSLTLDSNMKVTIGVFLASISTVIGATWWISALISGFRLDVAKLQSEQYTLPAASEQAARMAIENPGLAVPDPRDPTRVLRVDITRATRSP